MSNGGFPAQIFPPFLDGSYLPRIDDSARDNLFQNLLHLDIEFRRKRGETPSSEDYIKRFPEFAAQRRPMIQ